MSKTTLDFNAVHALVENGKLSVLFPELVPGSDMGTVANYAMKLSRNFTTVEALIARVSTGKPFGSRMGIPVPLSEAMESMDLSEFDSRSQTGIVEALKALESHGFEFTVGAAGINAHGTKTNGTRKAAIRALDTIAGTNHGPNA